MNKYYNSYFKIDMDEVVRNYGRVQKYVDGRAGRHIGIIPIVKGNCYGYGLIPMAKLYEKRCGAEVIATSALWEAVELRQSGIKTEILILGGIPRHHLEGVVKYNLQANLFEMETARILNELAAKAGKKIKVHIKIETGINRLGVRQGAELEKLITETRGLENIEIVGVFTHFATAGADYYDSFAIRQFEIFKNALSQMKTLGVYPEYVHCCNTAATAWFTEAYCTHVRPCSSILGHEGMEDGREPIGVVDPIEIGAFISNVHSIEKGESVGYGRAFIADRPMRVATLTLGFADGFYPQWMRGRGPVLINGKRAEFIGCCMDQSFADVTDIECNIGDRAILVGRDGEERISTLDAERFCGNTFEFLYGTIGPRVERIYENFHL